MKRIFITGASSGLGEGLARRYAGSGAVIGLVARRAAMLESLSRALGDAGARALVFPVDVSDTQAMGRACEEFLSQAGGVDLVVANAGVGSKSVPRDGNATAIAELLRINVIGVTNTVVPFVPAMIQQGSGVLCAVSSVAGHRALPGRAAYSASKAAVMTFMDGLRMDLHGTGVHAMTICPGFVRTAMTEGMKSTPFMVELDEAVRQMAAAIDQRRNTFTFPWQMNALRPVIRNAPEWLLRRTAPKPRAER